MSKDDERMEMFAIIFKLYLINLVKRVRGKKYEMKDKERQKLQESTASSESIKRK